MGSFARLHALVTLKYFTTHCSVSRVSLVVVLVAKKCTWCLHAATMDRALKESSLVVTTQKVGPINGHYVDLKLNNISEDKLKKAK